MCKDGKDDNSQLLVLLCLSILAKLQSPSIILLLGPRIFIGKCCKISNYLKTEGKEQVEQKLRSQTCSNHRRKWTIPRNAISNTKSISFCCLECGHTRTACSLKCTGPFVPLVSRMSRYCRYKAGMILA